MKGKTFTLKFKVDQVWIDDGFDLDKETAHDRLMEMLPYAHSDEIEIISVKSSGAKARAGSFGDRG